MRHIGSLLDRPSVIDPTPAADLGPPDPHSRRYRRAHQLDEETVARLVAEYEVGAYCTELALTFGISKTSVLKLLHRAGVTMRQQGLSAEELAQAVELYGSGLSLAKVAQKLDAKTSTVFRALQRADVELRPGVGGAPRHREINEET